MLLLILGVNLLILGVNLARYGMYRGAFTVKKRMIVKRFAADIQQHQRQQPQNQPLSFALLNCRVEAFLHR
jgi:hypothetical protein